ncbi:ParB/RepB/Spo0J family partition protein [Kitasatospora sp. NBC_01266]|uniref:ParB/RepB/Spo0J family partition protein n=1 Tax=Kitasatospora sp. NBC_01266 TaxID=2903572 RepID=UPI002E3136D1|nr:ParB/RepB/Spo0J family partition protein [Kitasatospora sp. NBC_01266]
MSRVADRVGAGSFGGTRAPRSERGRAKAVAEGTLPDYELQRLPLDRVAPCPMNPRRNYGSDELKTELGNSLARKQTTACVAVTREAYLKLWPAHEQLIPEQAEHVLLNGERRYRSAQHVGLESLDFVVRDDLAADRADFLDYLMIENEERADFDVIERARGVRQLLDACDNNAAEVARRRGKDRSWVGNQVALLTLPDVVQEQLAAGTLAERYGRRLARSLKEQPALDADALLDLAERFKAEERVRREEDRALRELAKGGGLATWSSASLEGSAKSVGAMLSADNTRQGMLSADNIGGGALRRGESSSVPEPAASAMLSADNIPAPANRTEPREMLSADNIDQTPQSAGGQQAPGTPMLSADNIPTEKPLPQQPRGEGRSGLGGTRVVSGDAQALVRALGATPAEMARTIRQGCSPEEITELLEELMEP